MVTSGERKCDAAGPPLARRVGVAQTLVQIFLGLGHGHPQRHAEAQPGGDGRGQSAARAVVVRRVHVRLAQGIGIAVRSDQPVRDQNGRALEVAALDQHGFGSQGQQAAARLGHVGVGVYGHARQKFGFGPVGREQIGQRQDAFLQRVHGVLLQQAVAALTHAYRVHHQGKTSVRQAVGHRSDDGGGKQHAGFRGVDGKARQHGLQLQGHKGRVRGVDARHPQAVLGGKGGNDAHAVCPEHGDGFQIGLNARASAGIGPGDGQDVGRILHGTSWRKKSDFSSHAPYRRRSSRGDASRKRPVPACFAPVAVRRRGGGACPSCLKLRFFLPMVELSWYAEPYLFSPSKELSGMPKLRILAPSLLALLLTPALCLAADHPPYRRICP